MKPPAPISLLGYALLGLLQQQPRSGYDVRQIFLHTPMGNYSDSPGAIYPALRRLEQQGYIKGRIEERGGMRRRKLFQLSARGLNALEKWLLQPVTREEVTRGLDRVMLRFAFSEGVLGARATVRLLKSLENELQAYLPFLEESLKAMTPKVPLSGRLALQSGIVGYRAHLRWAQDAQVAYQRNQKE